MKIKILKKNIILLLKLASWERFISKTLIFIDLNNIIQGNVLVQLQLFILGYLCDIRFKLCNKHPDQRLLLPIYKKLNHCLSVWLKIFYNKNSINIYKSRLKLISNKCIANIILK